MDPETKALDVTLTRELINLSAHAMAMQIIVENILREISDDDFHITQFRRELKDLTEKCRERVLLDFEKGSPGVAAFLDSNRPLTSGTDE